MIRCPQRDQCPGRDSRVFFENIISKNEPEPFLRCPIGITSKNGGSIMIYTGSKIKRRQIQMAVITIVFSIESY